MAHQNTVLLCLLLMIFCPDTPPPSALGLCRAAHRVTVTAGHGCLGAVSEPRWDHLSIFHPQCKVSPFTFLSGRPQHSSLLPGLHPHLLLVSSAPFCLSQESSCGHIHPFFSIALHAWPGPWDRSRSAVSLPVALSACTEAHRWAGFQACPCLFTFPDS